MILLCDSIALDVADRAEMRSSWRPKERRNTAPRTGFSALNGWAQEGAMSDTTRTEAPRLMIGTSLGLIPFGLAGAATMITFAVASFSFLDTNEATSRDSGGDRGFEVES